MAKRQPKPKTEVTDMKALCGGNPVGKKDAKRCALYNVLAKLAEAKDVKKDTKK